MSIGQRIKEARKAKKLTLKELGGLVGVTGGAITAWETGRNSPDAAMIVKLAVALDVTLNWLCEAPASIGADISPDSYSIAKIIERLPEEKRTTLLSVLAALDEQATATGANVIPRAAGNKTNRKKRQA